MLDTNIWLIVFENKIYGQNLIFKQNKTATAVTDIRDRCTGRSAVKIT